MNTYIAISIITGFVGLGALVAIRNWIDRSYLEKQANKDKGE